MSSFVQRSYSLVRTVSSYTEGVAAITSTLYRPPSYSTTCWSVMIGIIIKDGLKSRCGDHAPKSVSLASS
eukprot:scaffold228283_cov40-Attheya_sp.AAC.3